MAGLDDMVGGIAEVEAAPGAPHESWVRLRGETWRVASPVPLRHGQRVRVVARHGLLLDVVPIDDTQGESPCPPP